GREVVEERVDHFRGHEAEGRGPAREVRVPVVREPEREHRLVGFVGRIRDDTDWLDEFEHAACDRLHGLLLLRPHSDDWPPPNSSGCTPGMADKLEVSRDIAAPPDAVYAAISDVTQMGKWSEECVSCEWHDGFDRPAVGALFDGHNRNGDHEWTSQGKVI